MVITRISHSSQSNKFENQKELLYIIIYYILLYIYRLYTHWHQYWAATQSFPGVWNDLSDSNKARKQSFPKCTMNTDRFHWCFVRMVAELRHFSHLKVSIFCDKDDFDVSATLRLWESVTQLFLNLTVKLWLVWIRIKGEARAVCNNPIIHVIACQLLWGTVRLSAVMLTLALL